MLETNLLKIVAADLRRPVGHVKRPAVGLVRQVTGYMARTWGREAMLAFLGYVFNREFSSSNDLADDEAFKIVYWGRPSKEPGQPWTLEVTFVSRVNNLSVCFGQTEMRIEHEGISQP